MSTRRWALLVRSASLVACAGLLTSAHSVPSQAWPRTAPQPMADGGLSISAPPTAVASASGSPGDSFSIPLGEVTVTAPSGVRTWTTSATLTSSFRVTQGDQTWVLPNDRVSYRAGTLTSSLLALLGGCALTEGTLSQTLDVVTCSRSLLLGGMEGTVSWRPTLTIRTEPTDPAGTYTGTITHSVL